MALAEDHQATSVAGDHLADHQAASVHDHQVDHLAVCDLAADRLAGHQAQADHLADDLDKVVLT